MEKSITIENGPCLLEAMLNIESKTKAAVITHPHPLFGGNMDNAVVMAMTDAFSANGITTLRFNFRGAGKSQGVYDEGRGEQDDVIAAVTYLNEMNISTLYLAGYSFGSKINASVMNHHPDVADIIHSHIMVSPPVAFMRFDDIDALPKTDLVIVGSLDEFAPESQIRDHLERWEIRPQVCIINGQDHFYATGMNRLKTILDDYLNI